MPTKREWRKPSERVCDAITAMADVLVRDDDRWTIVRRTAFDKCIRQVKRIVNKETVS